jgi:ABC-type oligopeptide transport system substrate-binding subunit/DNA-binding SARP family transcriptional activator
VATLQLYFLGTLDLGYDGQQLPKPATLKSQSLLSYLILHRQTPQHRDKLATLFWGDRPESKARASLSTALWHIRRCLPEKRLMVSDPHTVQFDPQSDLWLDVDELEARASQDDIANLQSAVALYRGDFLDGFYDEWVISERYRLETVFVEALARLMVALEATREHEGALTTALRLLQQDPLREDAHRVAMRAYCSLGQRNAALEQYRLCQDIVQEELDAEPMVETTELYEAILEGQFAVERVPEVVPIAPPAVQPAPAAGRSPLDVVAPSKLVGREEELALLQDCWEGAKAGQGTLVLISGEAGVGKTRLVEEFANHLRWQGIRALWGRCYEFERVLPYQPVAEAVRTILPTLTPAELADFPTWALREIARLVPEVLEEQPGLEVAPLIPSDQERARLFEGVARFLAELSSHGAMLIVLEDLHWANESTLQLLHHLARYLANHGVLIVGTFRPEAIGPQHPLLDLRRQLIREKLAKPLRLSRLSPEAVDEMVMEMSGAGEEVVLLARRLYQETEGNPFFLMEIAKALFETGMIHLERGEWKGDFDRISEGKLPLPASVSEAIWARVHTLDEGAQGMLRLAAVLGNEFDFDLLHTVWDRSEDTTMEAVDVLLRHRLIDEGRGPTGRDYAFTHHKIQEVIYSALSRRRRQKAHARIGTAMESLYASEAEKLAGELAFHFQQGRQYDKTLTQKGIDYLLQAGDRARGLYAHEEAINQYQQALALLREHADLERSARTLMKLGLTYHTAFDFQQARQAYQEGFALWQQAGATAPAVPPPRAPHALRMAWHVFTVDPAMAPEFASIEVIKQLFSGLVAHSPKINVIPDVARSWEVSEGGRKYLFHLRDDVHWSDGTPVTAGDFEYAWKRVLNPAAKLPSALILYDVKGAKAHHQGETSDPRLVGVRAPDELTLVVELEGPTSYFPHLLTHCLTYPVPRHVVEKHGEAWTEVENIVTNGPFMLEAWQRGESMVLVRNPKHYGQFKGNVERVELTLVADPSAGLEMYEADDLDIAYLWELPPLEMDSARQRHAGEYVSGPTLATWLIGFNMSQPPFEDVRVRRAFVLATDRDRLAGVVMRGHFFPATGGLVPPGMPGHSAGIGLPYDPEGARQLLAGAGYPDGRDFPTVVFLTPPSPVVQEAIEYQVAQWQEKLGVEITTETTDWLTYFDRHSKGDAGLFFNAFVADYPDPDHCLRGISSGRRATWWRNEAYDRLLEEARRAMDQEERMTLYRQADRMLVEEAPIMPIGYARQHLLVKSWVSKFPTSAIKHLFWKDVIIESH